MSEDAYHFHHPVRVRFQDIDMYGHAHHSKPLVYFEEARWAYWKQVVTGAGVEDSRYVLAEFQVRYLNRILFPDTLEVGVRVTEIGRKHFVMEYRALSGDGEAVAEGRSVQVLYDYEAGGATSVPEALRAALEAFDGPF